MFFRSLPAATQQVTAQASLGAQHLAPLVNILEGQTARLSLAFP